MTDAHAKVRTLPVFPKPSPLQRRFVDEMLAIEQKGARDAGMHGFLARVLVQTCLPHSEQPGVLEYTRRNGGLTLHVYSPSSCGGIPYGTMPRLLLAWMTTEAVRTRSPNLALGDSLSEFMRKLDLKPTGGRWGTIARLGDQARRLFGAVITVRAEDDLGPSRYADMASIKLVRKAITWWGRNPNQRSFWDSELVLTQDFFSEIIDRPVPIDLRALRALRKSPLALDLYAWATYRVSYLRKPVVIRWEALMMQFGAGYASTARGKADFRKSFLAALNKVCLVYPALRADDQSNGLKLKPSPTSVDRRAARKRQTDAKRLPRST